MPNVGIGYKISNVQEVEGRLVSFNANVLKNLRAKARDRARETVFNIRGQMAAEYTSQWSTGLLAQSLSFKTFQREDGVSIQFYIANRRELEYITASLGGYFSRFPVRPFIIKPRPGKRALVIHTTLFGLNRGKLSSFGRVPTNVARYVRWGRFTGGFSRDVITEASQEEGAAFVADMEQAVSEAIVTMTSQGGTT